ncbi:MAG TPA: HD domain-containing protein [Ktedonobacteraceae bacterium]
MLSALTRVARFFADQQAPVYLVGGSLRNLLMGDPCSDWDLVAAGDAHKLARRLADTLGGFYAHMHERASRVVLRFPDAPELVLDISPLHGQTLEEDLRARDFTLNAMAAPLAPVLEQLECAGSLADDSISLIDPLHGLEDLRKLQLRVVDSEVFRRDPLRMLRALRFASRYHLTIVSGTEKLLRRDSSLLPQVAGERIQAELYTLLTQPGALEQLYRLDSYGLLLVLFPELQVACGMRQPLPHYWDVMEHSLQCVHSLEVLSAALEAPRDTPFAPELAALPADGEALAEIRELLREGEQEEVFQFAELGTARMKLGALLHDIGKPLTYTVDGQGSIHFYGHPQIGAPVAGEIMARFSASTQDRRLVQLITAHHMRPGQLGQDGPVTPRAIRRYFVDLGPTGILVALFSLADHLATLGPQPRTAAWSRHLAVTRLLLTSYIRERAKILPPRLVRADELMSRLRLQPGPILGQLLEAIAEAQADGLIHSREEAILVAKEYVETHQK